MKWYMNCLLILEFFALGFFTACAQGASAPGKMNCSYGGEICITLNTVQSFAIGNPVLVTIIVTSWKDLPDLHLSLDTGAEITLDGPKTWESNISNPTIDRGIAYWDFSIKAGQVLIFNRVFHLPSNEGYFHIIAEVDNFGRTIDAIDSFYIHLTQTGGQVILAGTPFPKYTPNMTLPAYGPGTPVPTLITNPTNSWRPTPVPSLVTTPTATQYVPLNPTFTPRSSPYPPPYP